jgi:hypothetical protein
MIKKITVIFLTSFLLLVLFVFQGNTTEYYNNPACSNCIISDVNNWSTTSSGNGTHPANFTSSGDKFFIQSASSMTGEFISVAGVLLSISGTWNNASGIIGSIDMKSGSATYVGGDLIISSNLTINSMAYMQINAGKSV